MKNFRFIAVATAAIVILSVSGAQAQPKDHSNWMEKIRSERIAFITSELDITPAEAQEFWPIYNEIAKKKHEAQKVMMSAYFAMVKAIDENTASEKEIEKLLENYLAAKAAYEKSDDDEAAKYRKALSGKKVAKLYVAEEKFRRMNIRAMRDRQPGHGNGRPDGAPGHGRPDERR